MTAALLRSATLVLVEEKRLEPEQPLHASTWPAANQQQPCSVSAAFIHYTTLVRPVTLVLCAVLSCRQGAVQFAFGAPPDTSGKSYAIETRLPPVALGGPSLEELQEGMVQLVPGTYQIVFDDE